MGGGGGGSSSSSTTTQQTDERVAASDQAVVIQIDEGSTLQVIDPEGQELLGNILSDAEDLFAGVLSFAESESAKANDLVKEVLNQAQTEDHQTFDKLLKLAGIVTAGYVAVKIFGKG